MAIEIERKYLMKGLPKEPPTDITYIEQCYVHGIRYRKEILSSGTINYIKLKKVKLGNGTNSELDIEYVTENVYEQARQSADRFISKRRHNYHYAGMKFEVDVFISINLIMMEVELEYVDQTIPFPSYLSELIIDEMTNNKSFDNFNLSTPNN